MNRSDFPFAEAGSIAAQMVERAYQSTRFYPAAEPRLQPLPQHPTGLTGFAQALGLLVDAGAALNSPAMLGHMDTAPHPAAAFADAVVSAMNNNMLFRELSPFASQVEEFLLTDIASRAGMSDAWRGTMTSGGAIANLSALFAAIGGFAQPELRHECAFFVPECAHNSIIKSLAVLGISRAAIHVIEADELGRSNLTTLENQLKRSGARRKIVVAVVGSTVHGAVEDIAALAAIVKEAGAWLHVDAIYGGALSFSIEFKHYLQGLDGAASVVMGPQKWMFVPRLNALLFIKGEDTFESSLGFANHYSANSSQHRGAWGLQGSRRADALTLWVLLQTIGTDSIAKVIDQSINTTRMFHHLLYEHPELKPSHQPDLNLQCFELRDVARQRDADSLDKVEKMLGRNGVPWVSRTRWRDNTVFRSVLLAPETRKAHLQALLDLPWA